MKKLLLDIRAGVQSSVDGWIKSHILQRIETEATVKAAAESFNVRAPCVLNIEKWVLPQQIDEYIKIVDWFREVRPDLRLGYYSLLPQASYWAPYFGGLPLQEWKQHNASLARTRNEKGQFDSRGLADVVDFICPSLYSRYEMGDGALDHEAFWFDKYAPANIEAAKRYQKQVYPFVWLRAAKHPHYPALSQELFRKQIQYCLDNADGVIIWDFVGLPDAQNVIKATEEVMQEFV
jgi:hypothetical protein